VNKFRRLKWAGHVARLKDKKKSALKILTGKPKIKRTLERPKRKWEDHIRMAIRGSL
jgi:hypothetical protein